MAGRGLRLLHRRTGWGCDKHRAPVKDLPMPIVTGGEHMYTITGFPAAYVKAMAMMKKISPGVLHHCCTTAPLRWLPCTKSHAPKGLVPRAAVLDPRPSNGVAAALAAQACRWARTSPPIRHAPPTAPS